MEVVQTISSSRNHIAKSDNEETILNQLEERPKLGDIIWIMPKRSSWWPAQVVDRNAVCRNYIRGNSSVGNVLVRLYGSYTYLYVDPMKYHSDFKNMLKQNSENFFQIFQNSLDQEIGLLRSGGVKKRGSGSRGKESEVKTQKMKKPSNDGIRKCESENISKKRNESVKMKVGSEEGKEGEEVKKNEKAKRQSNDGISKGKECDKNEEMKKGMAKSVGIEETKEGMMGRSSERRIRVMQRLGLITPSKTLFLGS